MIENIINLEKYRVPGSKVFTGRDRGIDIRNKSDINNLIDKGKVVVKIPKEIMSINPSFLEEFLFEVVNKLGKDNFYEKIVFDSEEGARYSIKDDLEEAIDRILRASNALAK